MADLIDIARAQQNSTLAALQVGSGDLLASLITAASDTIRRYCHRDFNLQTYSHYCSGDIYKKMPLLLRQYPVQSINRIGFANQAILIQNSGASCQRATVATTPDPANVGTTLAVVLYSMASAVPTTRTFNVASYPTLNALAAAITALGNGWSVSIQSGTNGSYALWPTADLKPLQGAVTALNAGAYLEIYDEAGPQGIGFDTYATEGDYFGSSWGQGSYRLEPETGELYLRVPRGQLNIRIDYTAGFNPIPQDVQEACSQQIQDLYQAGLINNSLQQMKLGNYSYQQKSVTDSLTVSGKVGLLLAGYVAHDRDISW